MNSKGKLYLIPNFIAETNYDNVFPNKNKYIIKDIRFFIVENVRTTRRFLRKIVPDFPIDDSTFYILNKHSDNSILSEYLQPAISGHNIGIISESGMPAIADPGKEIVKIAHQKNIEVVPLIGPSSIFLALAASGLNGQNFTFWGYLPIKHHELKKQIKKIENISKSLNQTQIFIETPYRNKNLYNTLLETCNENTLLCVANEITGENAFIKTLSIKQWKNNVLPPIHKTNTVFLLLG